MTVNYTIRLLSHLGDHIDWIDDFTALDWGIAENEVGDATITMPQSRFDFNSWQPDQIMEIWRTKDGDKQLIGKTGWLIRKWRYYEDGGESYAEINAFDAKDLLNRRIVAYPAGTVATAKNMRADDLMKEVIRENYGGTATDTARQLSTTYFTVQANSSLAGTVSKEFSRQNVLSLLKTVADNAKDNGDYLVFDVERTDHGKFEFRTFFGMRGIDRSSDSDNRKIISVEAGNLANPSLTRDHTTEKNTVYCGGQGIEAERAVGTAIDTAAVGKSYWNRCEDWTMNNLTDTVATLEDTAREETYRQKAKTIMTGNIIDSEGTRFGVDYGYGDIVSVSYLGVTVDCHIDAIIGRVRANTNGQQQETLTTRLRGEL